LVVNADDYGMSAGINAGVQRAFTEGIVTSASLMVRWPTAPEAARWAVDNDLALGLHVDLGEWVYDPSSDSWNALYEVADTDDHASVAAALDDQLETFALMAGRLPTHLDSHQHVHRSEPARSLFVSAASHLRIPLREFSPTGYCGAFYGADGKGEPIPGAVSTEALIGLLDGLPPGRTEVGCHPAVAVDHPSPYGAERVEELAALCSPAVRRAIETLAIELVDYGTDSTPKQELLQ
jgi:predicted glycoside hydrolase/deacetylase ChbG (UPF0249 family)